MRPISSPDAPSPIGPYSQAVSANGMLFVSGQVAINSSTGELVSGYIAEETHQVMKNIEALLKAGGCDLSNVLKCSIFLKDLNDFNAVNEVYGSYFNEPYPARECVQVVRLPKDVNVEISVIAML